MIQVAEMAKKKTEEVKTRKERRPVDLDLDLVPRIAMVAGSLGMSVPSYVNSRLRIVVDEELPRVLAAMNIRLPGQK